MTRAAIDIDAAIQETRQRYAQIPASLRPRKGNRPASRRTEKEAIALARAVYYAVKKAEEEGYIQKIAGGYKMSWTPVNKS